jgi:hypothetical protein
LCVPSLDLACEISTKLRIIHYSLRLPFRSPQAVIDAATLCLGLRAPEGTTLICDDAYNYVRKAALEKSALLDHDATNSERQATSAEGNPGASAAEGNTAGEMTTGGSTARGKALFDAIFVDVYDENNLTPPIFYSEAFLADCRRILTPSGIVMHNLHTGSATLDAAFASAAGAYARSFSGGAAAVPVVGQGNTILCGSGDTTVFGAVATTKEVMGAGDCGGADKIQGGGGEMLAVRVVGQGSRAKTVFGAGAATIEVRGHVAVSWRAPVTETGRGRGGRTGGQSMIGAPAHLLAAFLSGAVRRRVPKREPEEGWEPIRIWGMTASLIETVNASEAFPVAALSGAARRGIRGGAHRVGCLRRGQAAGQDAPARGAQVRVGVCRFKDFGAQIGESMRAWSYGVAGDGVK